MLRSMKWLAGIVFAVVLLILIVGLIDRWNWLRGPIGQITQNMTGRALVISGSFDIDPGWPRTRIQAANVTFANPGWAREKHLVTVGAIGFDLLLPSLFQGDIVLDDARVVRASANFEHAPDGRKSWLLDRTQRDEKARITIRHIEIDDGTIVYFQPLKKTDIKVAMSTTGAVDKPLKFEARGKFKGETLRLAGSGDSVLTLHDPTHPYQLTVSGRVGPTSVRASGFITDLAKPTTIDLDLALRGASLAQLYSVLGVVLPDTPAYTTRGRLRHKDDVWDYQQFKARIGSSDLGGNIRITLARAREQGPTLLTGVLNSRSLNFADLGPLVGTRSSPGQPAVARTDGKVLPTTAFRTERWNRMDADVTLTAASIKRPDALPIENLSTRLQLRDSVLTLSPLRFGVAGGTLAGTITLDGRQSPIAATTHLKVRKVSLAKLFPTVAMNQASIGQFHGNIDLTGRGDDVAAMLGSADGDVALIVGRGEISKFMMEAVGLHVLEMLQLKLTGDKTIRLRCGVADFDVKRGVMHANMLIVDTDITRISGAGEIDLANEQLDLTVLPVSKKFSLVALRTPIHIEGSFLKPDVSLNKGRLALRGLGALALGAINPLLTLLPLIETGPGSGDGCRTLIDDVKAVAKR